MSAPPLPVDTDPLGRIEIDGKDAGTIRGAWYPYTFPFNLTGHPALSMPCGLTREGLPVGLQLVARWNEDRFLLDVAARFVFSNPVAPEALALRADRLRIGRHKPADRCRQVRRTACVEGGREAVDRAGHRGCGRIDDDVTRQARNLLFDPGDEGLAFGFHNQHATGLDRRVSSSVTGRVGRPSTRAGASAR